MSINHLIRIPLFVVLFAIGASALSAAVLCADLLEYYHNRHQIELALQQIDTLQYLNADYKALVQRLTDNPSLVKRLNPVPSAFTSPDPNEVDPVVRAEQLAAAQQALDRQKPTQKAAVVPEWLQRCLEPRRRMALFLAGGALILTSFIFFGLTKPVTGDEE